MAKALYTQEQVFEQADALVAEGKEVTALLLLSKMGGSLTTIYKHLFAWQEARRQESVPSTGQAIPEAVQAAFATALGRTWMIASSEAGKEVVSVKEHAQKQVQTATKRFEEALEAIEKLEEKSDNDVIAIQELTDKVVQKDAALVEALRDTAAAKAAFDQLALQVSSLQGEIDRLRSQVDAERKEHRETIAAVNKSMDESRAQRDEAAKEAAEVRGQLRSLQAQNTQLIAKLEGPTKKSR